LRSADGLCLWHLQIVTGEICRHAVKCLSISQLVSDLDTRGFRINRL